MGCLLLFLFQQVHKSLRCTAGRFDSLANDFSDTIFACCQLFRVVFLEALQYGLRCFCLSILPDIIGGLRVGQGAIGISMCCAITIRVIQRCKLNRPAHRLECTAQVASDLD